MTFPICSDLHFFWEGGCVFVDFFFSFPSVIEGSLANEMKENKETIEISIWVDKANN